MWVNIGTLPLSSGAGRFKISRQKLVGHGKEVTKLAIYYRRNLRGSRLFKVVGDAVVKGVAKVRGKGARLSCQRPCQVASASRL